MEVNHEPDPSDSSLAASARAMLQLSEMTAYKCFCAIRIVISRISMVISATRMALYDSGDCDTVTVVHFDLSSASHDTDPDAQLQQHVEAAPPDRDRMRAVAMYAANAHVYEHTRRALTRMQEASVLCQNLRSHTLRVSVCVEGTQVHELEVPFVEEVETRSQCVEMIVEAIAHDLHRLCISSSAPQPCRKCGSHCVLGSIDVASIAVPPFSMNDNGCCDICRTLSARQIARWGRRCLSDPTKAACRKRLLREFAALANELE